MTQRDYLKHARRVVVKIGSSLIADSDKGAVHALWLMSVAADIAALMKAGKQVVVVSSGAVALGRGALKLGSKTLTLEQKQAAAAVGQIALISAWQDAFSTHKLHTAQVLLSAEDSEQRTRYLNARSTLSTLLSLGVIPVINENDTVATAELKVGDNDQLAARVAQMVNADVLVILSDIDGLYDANPAENPKAKFVAEVAAITPKILAMAGSSRSAISSGGMITKLKAAEIAVAAGCDMMIAKGAEKHPLKTLFAGGKHTRFVAAEAALSERKHWILGRLKPAGTVTVDAGAARALKSGKSLLPAGVTHISGEFARGDVVAILDAKGKTLGKGIAAYHAADAQKILGLNSKDIESTLGFKTRDVLIHRDDMALS
jgi:glutamate 5-kinase